MGSGVLVMVVVVAVAVVAGFSTAEDENGIWEDWVPWSEYALFPTLPIAAPLSEDEKCREDSRRLIIHLKNQTLWAVQMWDSSATSNFGVLYGNKYQFGNYEECLYVTEPIRAQYCHAIIRATLHREDAFYGDIHQIHPDPNATVWRKFANSIRDQTQYSRAESQWGLCVPKSCNSTEMEKAINFYLSKLNERLLETNGTTYEVEIPEKYCSDGVEGEFSYGEIGFWVFTWLVIILVGIATSTDLAKKKELVLEEWWPARYLMLFSLKRNVKKIMTTEESSETDHLAFLHGVRFMSIFLIVFDHDIAIYLRSAKVNTLEVEEMLRSKQNMFLPHGDLIVDSFFFVGGFLVCYMLSVTLEKKPLNWFVVILYRFFRLAPLYFYIIWFQSSAFERFGSGPVWKFATDNEVEFCKKNWWANLLFIQNYVNAKEMCMLHAWYLPCDFHFFVLTVFLMILLQKNKKIGSYVLHILTFVAIIIPGIVTYSMELLPLLSFNPKMVDEPRVDPSFEYLYVKSHTRAGVYLMGVLTAYHLYERRNSTWKISKRMSLLMCLLGLGLMFAPMVYGSLFYNPKKPYNLTESVIFTIFRRPTWGLGWVVFMIVNRFGVIPIFGKVFAWKISVPLSKLTYGVYLIHFLLQIADSAKTRVPFQFISFDMFLKGTSDLIFATGYSLVLYLFIELPFRLLFKELFFPKPKKIQQMQSEENQIPDKLNPPQIFSVKL